VVPIAWLHDYFRDVDMCALCLSSWFNNELGDVKGLVDPRVRGVFNASVKICEEAARNYGWRGVCCNWNIQEINAL